MRPQTGTARGEKFKTWLLANIDANKEHIRDVHRFRFLIRTNPKKYKMIVRTWETRLQEWTTSKDAWGDVSKYWYTIAESKPKHIPYLDWVDGF